jgi:hypothetical protein
MKISKVKNQVTLKKWGDMIHAQQKSGLTIKEWCERNGINRKSYYYRLKKVRLAALEESDKTNPYNLITISQQPVITEFIPNTSQDTTQIISNEDESNNAYTLAICINGAEIKIRNSVDIKILNTLLKVVCRT